MEPACRALINTCTDCFQSSVFCLGMSQETGWCTRKAAICIFASRSSMPLLLYCVAASTSCVAPLECVTVSNYIHQLTEGCKCVKLPFVAFMSLTHQVCTTQCESIWRYDKETLKRSQEDLTVYICSSFTVCTHEKVQTEHHKVSYFSQEKVDEDVLQTGRAVLKNVIAWFHIVIN